MPRSRLLRSLVLVTIACSGLHASIARSALIELQPSALFAGPGDSIALDIVVGGLGSAAPDALGAFDISVGFDVSSISFTGYSLGNFLGDVGLAEAIDASAGDMGGAVNVAEVSLLAASDLDLLQSDSFVLATLAFDVVNLGPSDFTQLSVLSGPLLVDAFGSPLSVTSLSGASVRGVSSPGTLMLLVASMLGWSMVRYRQPI
ncbi:hypothetical protein [Candidatus Marimicrobium litorale]|uniref:PEP-CTERM protein-sorting domain-containing protein n=1 Tax=Candidatus Marimicrobium litorale TaxID=2518991 RepID=A0ABT3T111_9GAMM|nr:hypothetical protein [Candidatus Marimicrobium litorale]MCX2975942.1 hypothetical protein [Candidatus Marimicrobium litorale]